MKAFFLMGENPITEISHSDDVILINHIEYKAVQLFYDTKHESVQIHFFILFFYYSVVGQGDT